MVAQAEAAPITANAIEVLACNWIAVEVFQRCQLAFAASTGGAICMGIAATEIVAAMQLQRLSRTLWRDVSEGVQLMGRVAAQSINTAVRSAPSPR